MNSEKKGILIGLMGGILWGIDTILVGVILSQSVFANYLFVAPFVATFLHDTFSSIWMLLYTGIRKNFKELFKSIKSKSGLFVMLAALFGGPIGMTGYILSIKYIGASYTAIISSMYPAIGAFLSYLILKEKMRKLGFIGLSMIILSTMLLGLTANEDPKNILLGFFFALLCVFGWGCEAVICAYGMKNDVLSDVALQIRQIVSTVVYGLLIIPVINGYQIVLTIVKSPTIFLIIITALAGTASYLFYYSSINKIGPIKAMGLNISYSAWAVLLGIFVGNPPQGLQIILAGVIIIGALLTTENPKEFLSLFFFKRSNK